MEASIAASRLAAETSPKPLQAGQLLGVQVVDAGGIGDQPILEEALRLFLTEPVDVHGSAMDEVLDVLEDLPGAAGPVRADRPDPLRLDRRRAADRALLGRLRPAQALALAALDQRCHDLGDDVAGPGDHHLVADADVLAGEILLVVERRRAHGHPAQMRRLEHREGDEMAGPADVPDDCVEHRRRRHRRELPGDRVARLPPDDAELAPEPAVVDLDDGAVDLVVEALPLPLPPLTAGDHLGAGLVNGDLVVDPEAALAQPGELVAVGRVVDAAAVTDPVGPDLQRALGGERRVLLADRSGGGVARVGECRQARLGTFGVEPLEAGSGEVDLAPNLDQLGSRSGIRSGIERIVRRLWVTSSPIRPSPRVVPRTKTPSS